MLSLFALSIDLIYLCGSIILFPLLFIKLKKAGFRISRFDKFDDNPVVFRCASVGEVTAVKKLIELLKKEHRIVIIVNTESGRRRAEMLYPDCAVYFAPLDFSICVRCFYSRVRPCMVILVEQELWPNFLMLSVAPLILVNARMTEKSASRYKKLGLLYSRLLSLFTFIFTSNPATNSAISSIVRQKDKVILAGNLKIDSIDSINKEIKMDGSDICIAVTNTHEPEEAEIIKRLANLKDEVQFRLIVAPRHIERSAEVMNLCRSYGFKTSRFGTNDKECQVVCEVGVLKEVYSRAHLAIIGGSFVDKGGHNFLEAAAAGCAIVQGPFFENFNHETVYFRGKNAIVILHTFDELGMKLPELIKNKEILHELGQNAERSLMELKGSSAIIFDKIGFLLRRTEK